MALFFCHRHLHDPVQLPEMLHCTVDLGKILSLCTCPCDNYYVVPSMKCSLTQPVTLPDQSRYPVPYYAISDFLAYRYTDAVFVQIILQRIHHQILVSVGFSISVNNTKFIV